MPDETLLGVLSLFGNEELAFVVTGEITKRPKEAAVRTVPDETLLSVLMRNDGFYAA